MLNRDNNAQNNEELGGIILNDDTGYEYRYIADTDDHRIVVEDNEEVTGSTSLAIAMLKLNYQSKSDLETGKSV